MAACESNPRTGRKLRTDVSATLFLSDPDDYDGGELEVADTYGSHKRQIVRRRSGALSRHKPAPGDADHAGRAAGVVLLDRKPDSRRRRADPCSTRWTAPSSS
ncbi:MAG: hypothetical protein WDM85_00705 [Caulobacteraceae bacterium]